MTKSNTNNIFSNLLNIVSGINESSFSAYDYPYDNIETNNTNYFLGGPQHLATFLHQLFSKMADNQTTYKTHSNSTLSDSGSSSIFPTSLFSFETFLSSSTIDTNSYHILSFISLWFVLIINPIVVNNELFIFEILFFLFIRFYLVLWVIFLQHTF
jgi:hypothetical protein